VTLLDNVGVERETIYSQLLTQGYLQAFMTSDRLAHHDLLSQHLSTVLANFMLQTSIDVTFNGVAVIDHVLELGMLPLISQFCQSSNLSIKANAAWLFTAICINRLVDPLRLTKEGLVRDIFVLYLDLDKYDLDAETEESIEEAEPTESGEDRAGEEDDQLPSDESIDPPSDADDAGQTDDLPTGEPIEPTVLEPREPTIIDEVLAMYNYKHFDRSIWKIMSMKERIQHLIFSIFTYLSIYDDPNIVSAVHKVTNIDVDKSVEEIALCGLKELLELNPEKMKLFIEILI
jgi:hypothetical protein